MREVRKISTGSSVSIVRRVTDKDIEAFSDLSFDRNLIHFDDNFAAKSIFRKRIAHGMIGTALISGGLTKLMGDGNIWLNLSVKFEKPIYINDELTCVLTVREVNKRGVATIDINIMNEQKENVISGTVQSMRFLV